MQVSCRLNSTRICQELLSEASGFYLGGMRLESVPGQRLYSLRLVIAFLRCYDFTSD